MTVRALWAAANPGSAVSAAKNGSTPNTTRSTSTPKTAKPIRVAVGRSTSATAASMRVRPPA